MHEALNILILICTITVLLDLLLMCFWIFNKRSYQAELENLPFVSVLIAARNEDKNIERCLNSLIKLDYPPDKLEVLLGDDGSEDKTLEVASAISALQKHIKVYSITKTMGNARGKANVLAHLAKEARGDFYFITDADVMVSPSWIRGMLRHHTSGMGIVTGVTAVNDNEFQNIDWVFAIGMVKVITDLGHPVTAMGNNMYVTRKAYEAVGGYETIPFSITEDFELFKHVQMNGFKVAQLFNEEVQVQTQPIHGIKNLLYQRKRWMAGAIQLPWPIVTLLTFQALYYPGILVIMLIDLKVGLSVCMLKLIVQSIFIALLKRRLHQRINWMMLLLYEVYAFALSIASSLFFLLPFRVKWKGRKY